MPPARAIKRSDILKAIDDLYEIEQDAAMSEPFRVKLRWAIVLLYALDAELGENGTKPLIT